MHTEVVTGDSSERVYIGRWAVLVALAIELAGAEERKPGLEMTGHGAVQHRALGMARVVELGSGRRR